uniref:Magnetosome protein Mad28-1 n=1 Tax=Candidatus Magnetananas rongchengensis TaxID=1463558 RepID=A0A3Q8B7K4_9BACT|nr:magnetosome protein Mad28-1 [Candidatus Magnetananas rongchenensis]
MIIVCEKCLKSYNLDENVVKEDGSKVSCSRCAHSFKVYPPDTDTQSNLELEDITISKKEHDIDNTFDKEAHMHKHPDLSIGPAGLDIGTSNIVAALDNGDLSQQLNAFFTVPESRITKQTLKSNKVNFFTHANKIYVVGNSSQGFANMFNTNLRRPIQKGFLNSREKIGVDVIKAIVNSIIDKAKVPGQKLCFIVPGEPLDGAGLSIYHESVLKKYISSLGYSAISLNEGLATVIAELQDHDYTGIGISMGGGMCNVCFSYLAVPVVKYSIQKGGDYIDKMTANAVGEAASTIKLIKEEGINLITDPDDGIVTALQIFYEELISELIESLKRASGLFFNTLKFPRPLPIVIGGGTVKPKGFLKLFEKKLESYLLPIEISEIIIADDPLNTSAKGALKVAISEI